MVRVAGKPIIQYSLELLLRYGIRDVLITTGHHAEMLENYFGDGSRLGLSIRYHRDPIPLGSAGGFRLFKDELVEDFLVLYGDVVMDVQLQRMIDFHRNTGADATLAVHPNDHPFDSDLVKIVINGRISKFYPKPHPPGLLLQNRVNAALYVLSPRVLDFIPDGISSDFGKDVFPAMLAAGQKLVAYETPEYMKDAGTPERLAKVEQHISWGRVRNWNLDNPRPAIFLDRDGVLNEDRHLIHDPNELVLLPGVAEAIRKINQSDYLSIVVTNQSAVARNLCSEERLQEIHTKLETDLGKQHAWLDAIFYCPHHPDKGFPEENPAYKIECECRKPKSGMIDASVRKFNVDLARSFMIGDTWSDVACGLNAGLTTIALRSRNGKKRYGDLNAQQTFQPHFWFDDLPQAVEFILNDPFSKVYQAILKRMGKIEGRRGPYVILVGGNSRSGKSSLASSLSMSFKRDGLVSQILSLDNWIVPLSKRRTGGTVLDRFDTSEILKSVRSFLAGQDVSCHPYDRLTREGSEIERTYRAKGTQVWIIEGVVALSIPELRQLADFKLFCSAEETTRKSRFFGYDRWRGIAVAETERSYEERLSNEYPMIERDANFADQIVNTGKVLI